MELTNKKMTEADFLAEREKVRQEWSTGWDPELDFSVSIPYLKQIPDHKIFAKKLLKAKQASVTMVQPRAGVPVLSEHIKLMQYLENAGADFLPTTVDSYTRQNRYREAEKGMRESEQIGRALLNGFPVVNHGVKNCKTVLESVNVPLQARHGTPDARLLAEIIHASGWTSNEGGGISYNIPYAKSIPLEVSLRNWQYCDRLVGFYQEQGITINREPFGPLTGTLVPPSISNAVGILEALLAAEQGVKSITVGYGMGGNIIQDIAAIQALQNQTEFYLAKYGYKDCDVSTVFHQWMGGFPEDESEAMGLISLSATVATLSQATKMITKSPHESIGIPTKEANGFGVKASKFVVNLVKGQTLPSTNLLLAERYQIEREVDSLIHCVVEAGKGDLAQGIVKAFEQGLLDIPFAPSRYNLGKILPARDNDGNIRILEFGNLGFTDDIKAFHRSKISERAAFENRTLSFQLTIDDVYSVSTGKLVGRPKNR
ncbi:MAG: methylaspartate mutase subunit E [Candidatus Izemoplasmatales bacterium]|jgi:methylaspartate mutase epsilon subunit|nr:methylaspartate mutase subunit E [Candidatus Izemoplasmatales bacterium]MDD4354330.1 methylaspartate mutase subunit E [Candidatus Izemoplasmatales bacterium]MDD4987375.1 methylaspartate mutase subunit E [Candidatus Izemoplasmatales bacterium]MDY0372688.1 methylaspartate mutase subunit E [Candidatus Izemoplasmatales bacterium]NLF48875.1 methylaspartate mutase subunit E [Acholeplasmataceae bacterium]